MDTSQLILISMRYQTSTQVWTIFWLCSVWLREWNDMKYCELNYNSLQPNTNYLFIVAIVLCVQKSSCRNGSYASDSIKFLVFFSGINLQYRYICAQRFAFTSLTYGTMAVLAELSRHCHNGICECLAFFLQIGECVATWWRPNFETIMYPYCPPHISKPKVKNQIMYDMLIGVPQFSSYCMFSLFSIKILLWVH